MNEIHKSIVKLACGSDRGTAFFISENQLLTARHNIISNLVNEDEIIIQTENNVVKCSIIEQIENVDFALIETFEYKSPNYLELVNMPIEKGYRFHFFGYSNTLIGQSSGISLDIQIQDYFSQNQSDFDSTAIITDTYQPSIFNGFSGSPVYAAEDKVLGIVVKKLDGCIGFVSVKLISEKLKDLGINILENAPDFIEDSYSKRANRLLLEKAIKLAGQRFERELHQPNRLLESKIEQLWNLQKHNDLIEYIKNTDHKIKEFIRKKDIKLQDNINLETQVLIDNFDLFSYYWSINNNDDVLNSNDQKIEFTNKEVQEIKQFRENLRFIQANNFELKNRLIIKGLAGTGKTHLMCNIAETLINNTNIYLCFGTQFNKIEDPLTQIQRIFDFEDKNYLDRLNQQANSENKRYIFIIDALNEGAGDNYWKARITQLEVGFLKYNGLVLITTVRTPFENKIYPVEPEFYSIEGFENTEKAIKAYFNHYQIDSNEGQLNHYEFKNGLFLKIFCETYSNLSYYQRKELNTYSKLFRAYVQRKEFDIADKIDEDEKKHLGITFLKAIAKYSVNDILCQDIERQQARKISDRLCPYRVWSKSLLNATIEENLLLENLSWDYESDNYIDTLSFAYERLGDFLKAISTIESRTQKGVLSDRLKKIITESEGESKIINYIVALNVVWQEINGSELIEDLKLTNIKVFIDCFIASIPLRKKLQDTSYIRKLINEYLEKDSGARYIFNFFGFSQNEREIVMYIHDILLKMELSKRDIVWTTAINELYVNGELSQYYSTEIAKDIISNKNDEDCFHYVVFLSWLLTSSHPIVRDSVTRILFYILKNKTTLIPKLLNAFEGVNDLYVLERLYCAIYGVILVSEEDTLIEEIALEVYNRIYKDKKPPCNILLREWTLKILDRARYLGIQKELFDNSLPPFNNVIELPKELDYLNLLGTSKGSNDIYQSVFEFSDFARYEIGTNSNNNSNQFTKNKISDKLIGKPTFFELAEIQKMILLEIQKMGWNDDLGKLDNRGNSYNRYKNDTERIGKKYQWLALYSVVARILDNYKLNHRWGDNKIHEINYPWLTSYHSFFDPTLPIKDIESSFDLGLFEEFVKPKITMGNEYEWLNSIEELPQLLHFEQTDKNDEKWILLSTMDTYKTKQDNITKEFFLRYDSVFVSNVSIDEFDKWAKDQNFYGRWMPEWHDNIDFILYEYVWSTQYEIMNINNKKNPGYSCPCEVVVTTEAQLQENSNGTDEAYSGTTLLPNHEIMTILNLKLRDRRGQVYNKDGELIAIYNRNTKEGKKGLYIKQKALDEYLKERNYTLVYYLTGEKCYYVGEGFNANWYRRDLTGAYKYKDGIITTIQDLHMVEIKVKN